MKINEFLVKAKRNTYAGDCKEIILPDGGKELTYEETSWKYQDRYYRFNPFFGQELVWKNNELIWGMNYYGKVRDDFGISVEEIYKNLKKALLQVYEEAPFRGPKSLKLADYLQYFNKYTGNVDNFEGKENIYFREALAYSLIYHGGSMKQNARN